MMKQLETVETPGAVLMICKPGRRVLPVVLMAPDTKPSALPSYTIMAAKNRGSSMVFWACSMVTPFLARILAKVSHYRG